MKDLDVVSDSAGVDDFGLGILLQNNQIKKMTSSYVGENHLFERLYVSGNLIVELTPQGNLVERLRAGGAGIPAFYTATGVDTVVESGGFPQKYDSLGNTAISSTASETRSFGGKKYILQEAIVGDYALIKAKKADKSGNLVFNLTARNFNPDCAKAAKITIAEVEEIVENGTLTADEIHLPGIFVDKIVLGNASSKRIEHRTFKKEDEDECESSGDDSRLKIAHRASKELKDGLYVNLGIGLPTLASNFIPKGSDVVLQSENGMLGMGPYPNENEVNADLINAGKETVSLLEGSSTFSSCESFSMIRGGHLDLTILGALQVSHQGDLANWVAPGKKVNGMGGAMDLVSSGTRVIITMKHNTKDGDFKIKEKCSFPLTGSLVVDRIITEIAVFDIHKGHGMTLVEIGDGISLDEVKKRTGCSFHVADNLVIF